MALIKCPECGKTGVSDKASNCPDCGINIKNEIGKLCPKCHSTNHAGPLISDTHDRLMGNRKCKNCGYDGIQIYDKFTGEYSWLGEN